jgi:uncharacterized protein YdeI (YjbR/CyaY-like superfamily)
MTASDRFPHVEVSSAEEHLTTDEVLDALVSFGWIDGVRRRVDAQRTMQLISPRRTKPWARTYKIRAERLIAEGAMHESGLAGVRAARRSGAWDAMNDVDELVIPDDLRDALVAAPPAWDVFSGFPPSVTRNILRWIASAKTAPTRTKRIAATTEEARQGRRVASNG